LNALDKVLSMGPFADFQAADTWKLFIPVWRIAVLFCFLLCIWYFRSWCSKVLRC